MPENKTVKKSILIVEDDPIFNKALKENLERKYQGRVTVEVVENLDEAEKKLKTVQNGEYFLGILDLALSPKDDLKYFFPLKPEEFEGIKIKKKYSEKFQNHCILTGTPFRKTVEAVGYDFKDIPVFSKSHRPTIRQESQYQQFEKEAYPNNILSYIDDLINKEDNTGDENKD